jgi:hypothetical protein
MSNLANPKSVHLGYLFWVKIVLDLEDVVVAVY